MKLSRNFSDHEFLCHCACGFGTRPHNVSYLLIEALQALRDRLGEPLHVSSGCRCEHHNCVIGGELGSQHTKGMAADVYGPDPDAIEQAAEKIPAFHDGGLGRYNGDRAHIVHLDVRGHRARWIT